MANDVQVTPLSHRYHTLYHTFDCHHQVCKYLSQTNYSARRMTYRPHYMYGDIGISRYVGILCLCLVQRAHYTQILSAEHRAISSQRIYQRLAYFFVGGGCSRLCVFYMSCEGGKHCDDGDDLQQTCIMAALGFMAKDGVFFKAGDAGAEDLSGVCGFTPTLQPNSVWSTAISMRALTAVSTCRSQMLPISVCTMIRAPVHGVSMCNVHV
jgi:hypothetical protein